MKKLFLIGIILLCSCLTNAQDTIVKRNGDNILSKIIEISETEVKYKKFDFQDGPNFIENKSDIQLIKYSNGTKDEFKIQPNTISKTNESKTDYYAGPLNSNIKIESHNNRFRYNGKRINEPELHRILLSRNDPQITLLKNSARRYKKLQYCRAGWPCIWSRRTHFFRCCRSFRCTCLKYSWRCFYRCGCYLAYCGNLF